MLWSWVLVWDKEPWMISVSGMCNWEVEGSGVGDVLDITDCSGEGGSGGREVRYLYIFVCFGRFGLDGGGRGFSSLGFELLVLTMNQEMTSLQILGIRKNEV